MHVLYASYRKWCGTCFGVPPQQGYCPPGRQASKYYRKQSTLQQHPWQRRIPKGVGIKTNHLQGRWFWRVGLARFRPKRSCILRPPALTEACPLNWPQRSFYQRSESTWKELVRTSKEFISGPMEWGYLVSAIFSQLFLIRRWRTARTR